MEKHLYSRILDKRSAGEEAEYLGYLKCFLNEDKEVDRLIRNRFPIEYFGNSGDLLKIKGSKMLVKAFDELDADKDDFMESLQNIEYVGLSDDNELILNFVNQDVKAIGIYNFTSEFLREFGLEKYADFCIKNNCPEIIKDNLVKLFKKFYDKEKQYRLLRERDNSWRIRGLTSDKYNNYDNNIVLYLSLLALNKYAEEKGRNFYVETAYVSDSELYIFFEQEVPVELPNIGKVYLGVVVSNGEIRNRTFKIETRYKIFDTNNGVSFSAILNNSIFSIVHNTGIPRIEEHLNSLMKLNEHENSIVKFITDLYNSDPLSNDAVYLLMSNLVEKISSCSDISKKTKDSYKQVDINNIINNTITTIEFLGKVSSVQTDIDERVFVERIFHQVMHEFFEKRKEK